MRDAKTMYGRSFRLTIIYFVLLIGSFLALAARCFYLQHFKADHYIKECLRQQQFYSFLEPQRGVVLDACGRVLAASNRIRTIFAEPRIIKEPKNTSNKLAPIVDMGAHEICKLIMESKNPGYVKIKADVTSEQARAAGKIYGVGVRYDWVRYYPMGRLTSHAVGFTSTDNHGLGGIEFQYCKDLCGLPAKNVFLADVRRRPIRPIRESIHESSATNHGPRDGCGIILTLDAAIQQFARAELIKQYESYEAESALAVVADPKTGAILAMVSLPDFEPAEARFADANCLCNRVIGEQYEPGSIIKPIVAAIALDAGVVNEQEKIFCEHGSYSGRGFGRIGEYRQGFGDLTVREILVHSSNIGMAKIGQRLGKEKLYEGLKLVGFGKKIDIELPGEAQGLLRPPSQWTGYSETRIPFGQEVSVTVIQLLQAFCILANNGRLVHPYLVKAKVSADGSIIDARPPKPGIGYVIRPEVARWLIGDALTGVINQGTGTKARLNKWQVFGKSGTAQLAGTDGKGYGEGAYIASFVAGAPADDPQVIVLVSIRRPNVKLGKGYTGGVVAAPAAALILEKTLNYLERNTQRAIRYTKQ